MPYFVFEIRDDHALTLLDAHDKYRDAKQHLRRLRSEQADPGTRFRMVYAANPTLAEQLLLTPREAPVEGDD